MQMPCPTPGDVETWSLCTGAKSNLGDRVLGAQEPHRVLLNFIGSLIWQIWGQTRNFLFFKKKKWKLFIYLFLAVLGLRFCARAFSSCGNWGPLFIAVRRPLTIVASLVPEHRLQTRRLSNCGSQAQLLCGMRDPPRPGLEPVSPALAGRLATTAPPGKPSFF